MSFEITYSIIFVLLIFLVLRFSRLGKIVGLNNQDLAFAFLLKSVASLIFIYIFTWHYGEGVLVFDSNSYIADGKILNSVFYSDPIDYLKLLTGIGENEALIQEHLHRTSMWSRPFNFLNNDTKNVIRINSIIHFFSFDTIYVHFLTFNLIALFGITQIYLFFKKFIVIEPRIFFFALILFPSLLFWGSAVLKEGLLILSIGLFLRALSINILKPVKLIFIVITLYIMLSFKAYVVLSLFIPFVFLIQSNYFLKNKAIGLSLLSTCSIVVFTLVFFPAQRQSIVNHISNKQFDFDNMGRGGYFFKKEDRENSYYILAENKGNFARKNDSLFLLKDTKIYCFNGKLKNEINAQVYPKDTGFLVTREQNLNPSNSYITTDLIFSSQLKLIKNIPQALINALFRPFPTDSRTKFNLIQFAETTLIFGLLIIAVIKRKKLVRNEKSLLIALLIFVVSLSLIVGWTTTIAGAIVRYRIPIYLAILIATFILYNPKEKWKNKEIIS